MFRMLTVKEAVKAATQFFVELFPNAPDVRLEEVELSNEAPMWNITLSFALPSGSSIQAIMAPPSRAYKLVKIDSDTGELVAIKIRQV